MNDAKVVIFGAGNIGRSFIAPVFMNGGYEIIFIDVIPMILDALKTRNFYDVVYKDDLGETRRRISPVRGVDARNEKEVKRELDGAALCVTCVGAGALPAVLKSIAAAVAGRRRPLDIVLAENLKGAAELAAGILKEAQAAAPARVERIGLVETSIGKMVPIMPAEVAADDPLLCWAEPYNTLIVDADGFTGPIPEVPDIMAVSPIEPWVARKLYIHNFGHAAVAYLGFRDAPGKKHVWEVLEDDGVAAAAERAMRLSGAALCREFPGVLGPDEIESHVTDLIRRFRNRALGDTLYRVGRDLRRKLNRKDRVVGALELVRKHGLDVEAPLDVFRAALSFAPPKPEGLPDRADSAVRALAGNTDVFLRDVIGLNPAAEPELEALLRRVLDETE